MPNREPSLEKPFYNDEIYETLASLGKAFESPVRLKLLHLLAQCERSVEDLAEAAEAPLAKVSHHLQRLKSVKLVRSRKEGRRVIYGLADRKVMAFWIHFRDFAVTRFPELAQLADPAARGLEAIEQQDADDLLGQDKAVLVDVRPAEEFRAGHLPGALSLPLADMDERIGELPDDKTLILCCRGPYCPLADQALSRLGRVGIRAVRLTDGPVEREVAGQSLSKEPQ